MKRTLFTMIAVWVLTVPGYAMAQTVSTTGRISDVIVYRGQALVTRTIETDAPAGSLELIVGDLPEQIVPESLYSQASSEVTVLSVRYRQRAIREDTRQEVKDMDNQIKAIEKQLRKVEGDRQHLCNQWEMFTKLKDFTAEAGKTDLSRGMLTYEPIEKLTGLIEEKGWDYHERSVGLVEQSMELKEELELLKRKRNEMAAGNSRTEREVVIFLTKADESPAKIELSYLVDNAGWTPQYNLRADVDHSQAVIEYIAVVHQASGESWENTSLALSTAEPSMVASPPVMGPMKIALGSAATSTRSTGQAGIAQSQMEKMDTPVYLDQTQRFDDLRRARGSNLKKGKLAEAELNTIATDNQMLEFSATRQVIQEIQQKVAVIRRTEGVSVMYKLPNKLSLPSRSDQQLLTIASIHTKADFTLLATPLLTDYVYLQGSILNDSDTIMLPGPATMYRNGQFVGKGQMNLVTIGQRFTAGFGIDSQIQVTRQFKDKKVEELRGNRTDTHRYQIEISNFKNETVKLRLLERIPYTENSNIEVALLETSHELSQDGEYLRTQRDKGILRWDLTIEPNTTGETATMVTYGFTMKYDNDMRIQTVK